MNNKTAWYVKVAMLSAVATILMLFEFPLPFVAPPFYELDFSEVPVLLGAFALGPLAGVTIEGVKILLNFIINGTVTAGVGEVANFVMGVLFILPAALVYKKIKSKKGAMTGLLLGGIAMIVGGCLINAFVMLPVYAYFLKMPIGAFFDMASKIWPQIDTMLEFVVLCVAPFNLVKVVFVSAITLVIYKPLRRLLKGVD